MAKTTEKKPNKASETEDSKGKKNESATEKKSETENGKKPTAEQKKSEVEDVSAEKVAPVENKVVNTTPVNENVEKPVEKTPEPIVEKPAEPKPFDIYDHEPVKQVLPFPQTQLQTETFRVITMYGIDATRLPQDVVKNINDFLSEFTTFLSNEVKDVTRIKPIMDKDNLAATSIKAWFAPKAEYFEKEKAKKENGTTITDATVAAAQANQAPAQPVIKTLPDGKIVVDKNNVNTIIESAPSVPSSVVAPIEQNGNTINHHPYGVQHGQHVTIPHNPNPLQPRMPTTDYVPTIDNNQVGYVRPPAYGDTNKAEMIDIMARMAGNTGQTLPPVVDPNFLESYTKTIFNAITVGFPMYSHWKYAPVDTVKDILKNSVNTLSYEVVLNGEQSFIKVSNGIRTVETERFNCK